MHAARIGGVVEKDELPAGGRVSRKVALQELVIPLPRRIAMGTVAFQNDEVGLAGIEGIVPVRHEEVLDARGALLRCVVVISEHPDNAMGVQEIGVLRKNVDRKSTRLNSSHSQISYAVFCLNNKPYIRSR